MDFMKVGTETVAFIMPFCQADIIRKKRIFSLYLYFIYRFMSRKGRSVSLAFKLLMCNMSNNARIPDKWNIFYK